MISGDYAFGDMAFLQSKGTFQPITCFINVRGIFLIKKMWGFSDCSILTSAIHFSEQLKEALFL